MIHWLRVFDRSKNRLQLVVRSSPPSRRSKVKSFVGVRNSKWRDSGSYSSLSDSFSSPLRPRARNFAWTRATLAPLYQSTTKMDVMRWEGQTCSERLHRRQSCKKITIFDRKDQDLFIYLDLDLLHDLDQFIDLLKLILIFDLWSPKLEIIF